MSYSSRPVVEHGDDHEDTRSELGGAFEHSEAVAGPSGGGSPRPQASPGRPIAVPIEGVTRRAPASAKAYGRGAVPADPRKFRYDRNRAQALPSLPFGATRADRMSAEEAGEKLDRIHEICGIARDSEDVLSAFDKALFFEHAVNGASLLQPGRGHLVVGKSTFDLTMVKKILGVDQRRFFRAYADEIADTLREVLAAYDPYEPVTVDMHGQVMQLAVSRGLQKYPYLIHDSSDAGVRLSVEERVALENSKRVVLTSVVNNADKMVERAPSGNSRADADY